MSWLRPTLLLYDSLMTTHNPYALCETDASHVFYCIIARPENESILLNPILGIGVSLAVKAVARGAERQAAGGGTSFQRTPELFHVSRSGNVIQGRPPVKRRNAGCHGLA